MGKQHVDFGADTRVEELYSLATEVFGDRDVAYQWLHTPLSELSDVSPAQSIQELGAAGLEDAKRILIRIEYGVYS